jgi:tetratricopeptide (TPR) repeat protein
VQIRLKLHGEHHPETARSYWSLGITQREMKDYKSALASQQHALQIELKLFGENLPANKTGSYDIIGDTQCEMEDYNSAVESYQHALQLRLKLYGEDHPDTAKSYENIQLVQDRMKNVGSIIIPEEKKLPDWMKYL